MSYSVRSPDYSQDYRLARKLTARLGATFGPLLGRGLGLLLGLVLLPLAATAMTVDPVQQSNSNAVWFENWSGLSNATLVVAAPNGKVTEVFAASGTPVYELNRGEVQDGIYRYELKAATQEMVEIVNPIDNGRGETPSSKAKAFYMTGFFTVSRGVIIIPEEIRED
ncbi:hypothetical protein ACFP4H_06215 [Pseudophaeobacter arcticus]|uniref:hypothetical protein n=1 Tax=Pseudophaeobacter arcticus TaxID=385492 RepID=UPI00041672B8|nr:hypothetical protein [Pseudophaeobacter arcticus]